MDREYFKDCRAWITGATSGIGRSLTLELVRRGARVAVSGRNSTSLDSLVEECGKSRVLPIRLDVTRPDENREAAEHIRQAWGGLDLAVLNAGVCEYVDVRHFDADLFVRVMTTNFCGLMRGVEAALPLLRESPCPHLAGMSSAVALGPLPRAEAYGASKAAVRYALTALRMSLHRERIAVTTICPGFVKTPLTDLNDFPMPFLVEPEIAARGIADGLARRAREIHFPRRLTLPYRVLAALPGCVYEWLVEKALVKP